MTTQNAFDPRYNVYRVTVLHASNQGKTHSKDCATYIYAGPLKVSI